MTQTGTLKNDLRAPEFVDAFRSKNADPMSFPIAFPRPFANIPAVTVGLSALDAGGDHFRFRFTTADISEQGFHLVPNANRNWLDSLELHWLATDA